MKNKKLVLLVALVMLFTLFAFMGTSAVAEEPVKEGEDTVSLCLKDDWHVYVDNNDIGEKYEWYTGFMGKGKVVSLPVETSAWGYTGVIWFGNTFNADFELNENERVVLEFEGVQYYTKVWLNGAYVGDHEGTYGAFSLDVTDYIREGEANLLALRCYAPKPGDTYRGMSADQLPLWLGGFQHIQTPVYVKIVPQVSIEDTYVVADYDTGKVDVELYLNNPGSKAVNVALNAGIKASNSNFTTDSLTKNIKIQPGDATIRFSLQVDNRIPWDLDNPYLYDVLIDVTEEETGYKDSSVITTGFKEFYVDDGGYFVLNGERIFLKCAHTAPYVIGSVDVGDDIERQLHQMDYLKSIGNNIVRFIDGPALPEMLDYCDRIGLLVYEETAMSWTQVDGSLTPEMFQQEMAQLLMRDRSHVSFGILGLLNETYGKNETSVRFQTAVDSLEHIRSYDEEVLVLLSSGRWDYTTEIASACNPGSTTWDGYMGNEGQPLENATNEVFASSFKGMGDIHFYPSLPYDSTVGDLYQAIGDIRASFVSEAGAGSQPNILADYRTLQQEKNKSLNDGMQQAIARQLNVFQYIYDTFGMYKIYPTLESFLIESEATQSSQRSLLADYIRSNSKINGYSMTQGADIGYRGEGVLEGSMAHKEDMYDYLTDAWSDLRWCINLDAYNIYADQPLVLDIKLSDIGILENKEYSGLITIVGEEGTVYSDEFTVTPDGSFAFPVFQGNVDVSSFKTGEYKVSCVLYGEEAAASTKSFWVTQRSDMPKLMQTKDIYAYDVPENILNALKANGIEVKEMTKDNVPQNAVILLGHNNTSTRTLEPIFESVKNSGSHCIGVTWSVYGEYAQIGTPFEEKFVVSNASNWLYHSEAVIFETDVTTGLHTDCLVDPLYFESVYDAHYYSTTRIPDAVHSISMFIGNDGGVTSQELIYGITCASYSYGKGDITFNTFDIAKGAGSPVADRLLINMINYQG